MDNNQRRNFLRLAALAAPTLALAACSDDDDAAAAPAPAPAAPANLNSTLDAQTARTRVPTMLLNAPGAAAPGYDILPLVSAGDDVPLLTGTYPQLVPDAELTYGLAGDFDGMGLLAVDDGYYLWVNHELAGDASEPDDFQQTIFSQTISGIVPGARVSLIKLTKDWKVVGAMPLIRSFQPTAFLKQDDGSTPRIAAGSRIEIDLAAKTYKHAGWVPSDFCGGTLAETGFVDPQSGQEVPVWFTNEENAGYSGVAWACFPSGMAYPVEGLGLYEKETTVSLRKHRPKPNAVTLLVGSEDDDDGEIYLWVGTPTASDPNGLVTGQLYVMKIQGAARESGPGRFDGQPEAAPSPADAASTIGKPGDSKPCTWTPVPDDARRTLEGLADFVTGADSQGVRRSTSFLAPEDINEDAVVDDRLWLAADGGADSLVYDDDGPRYENPYSRLYRIDLGIVDPKNPAGWATTITYAVEGGPGKGVSYDNLAPDSNGKILMSEDWDQGSDEADAVWAVLKQERRAPGLYQYDIASGAVTPAFLTNQAQHDPALSWDALDQLIAAGNESVARDDFGFWETSGQIEVLAESRNGRSAYLIGVQAHSFKPSGFEAGGQIVLCKPKASA
jgi:glycerophosphoryl diester phosphodiesterase